MSLNPLTWFNRKPADDAASMRAVAAEMSPRAIAGGRATIDTETDLFSSSLSILSTFSDNEHWRHGGLDSKLLDGLPLAKLVKILAKSSPDVSKALWDFLRFCNPGHEAEVFKPGSGEAVKDEDGQAMLDSFIGQLHGPYSANNIVPLDVIVASMFISIFFRGALCTELVLDKQGRTPLEVAVPDPVTIKFKRMPDEERGFVWQMGQHQRNRLFVPIDKPTVSYIPIDPLPGEPWGNALSAPAVFSCLFLIGLLHDLRRVVAQQGYPRLDIEIDFKVLIEMMPPDKKGNPTATRDWIDACVEAIKAAYAALKPDSAYVHHSGIKVNRPVGTLDASSLKGSEGLISALERFTVRGLKTMPFLMGINDSTTETMANRQYEAYVSSIDSIQHIVETTLEKQFGLALRVQGKQARVVFRFAKSRKSERLRDAQAEAQEIRNARMLYDNGSIGADEMARRSCGKSKADASAPRAAIGSGSNQPTDSEPGANRGVMLGDFFKRLNPSREEVERALAELEAKGGAMPETREPVEVGGVQ